MAEDQQVIEEHDIRDWFKRTDLEQALDTFNVVEGILEMRQEASKRKPRRDRGTKRGAGTAAQESLPGVTG